RATAEEIAASGEDWAFAPTLAVPRDERWGRTFEGYSEDPAVVAAYAAAMIRGLQGPVSDGGLVQSGPVVAAPKHFLGDGATAQGQDQGDAKITEEELIAVHAAGYAPAIEAGALSIMVSISSWNGVKMIANEQLLTDVLKGRMGFRGIILGDWNAHGQVPG